MIDRSFEGYHLTVLHTKYIGVRPCGSREEDFFIVSHNKPLLDNTNWCPRGMASLGPRDMVGRIYEGGN